MGRRRRGGAQRQRGRAPLCSWVRLGSLQWAEANGRAALSACLPRHRQPVPRAPRGASAGSTDWETAGPGPAAHEREYVYSGRWERVLNSVVLLDGTRGLWRLSITSDRRAGGRVASVRVLVRQRSPMMRNKRTAGEEQDGGVTLQWCRIRTSWRFGASFVSAALRKP